MSRDWLKERYPRLGDAELDRLVEIMDTISAFAGQRRTVESYQRIGALADEMTRILGRKDALKLSSDMLVIAKNKGTA